jgi:spore maturation protein CgeB
MLLESANEMTRDFFDEGKEFVSFAGESDLIAKVRHYLAHPEQAAAIAAAARRRFLNNYAAPYFWRELYDRARLRHELEPRPSVAQ